MRLATWNLERKKPTSLRGSEAVEYLHAKAADVVVLTEARTSFPARGGHLLFADRPVAARFAPDERKVGIWSRNELEPVPFDSKIDPTRFIAARIKTPTGSLLILAVCIPWHMAGVGSSDGAKDKPWEQHVAYLHYLAEIFSSLDEPFVVAGDFNQRYPRQKYGNKRVAEELASTFAELAIVTAGVVEGCTRPGIDHIAITPGIEAKRVTGWPHDATGNHLTDHDGVMCELTVGL